jgi:hypothetical protein
MTLQRRHAFGSALPEWLQGPNAQSFFTEGLCVLYDVDRSWFEQALFLRYPSLCDSSALPLLLLDRRLRRGPQTSDDAVRRYARLWIDQWQLAGLFSGLLLAAQAFLAPDYPQIRIWTRGNGSVQTCYTIAEGTVGRALKLPGYTPLAASPVGDTSLGERLRWAGVISQVDVPAGTMDWDSVSHPSYSARWWHFWMTIHGKPLWVPWQYDTVYDYDTPSLATGTNYWPGEMDTLDLIVRDCAPHETRCVSMVLCPNNTSWDPEDPNVGDPGFGWPDGYWGYETKDDGMGNIIPAKNTDFRYWEGIR